MKLLWRDNLVRENQLSRGGRVAREHLNQVAASTVRRPSLRSRIHANVLAITKSLSDNPKELRDPHPEPEPHSAGAEW